MLDEVDYKNGQKNNWRQSLWNAVIDRLYVPPRDALVLYLAGESDHDRATAVRKGFKPANLIAVDRSFEKIRILRRKGVTAIQGDIFEVAAASSKPIHFLHVDLCRDLSEDDAGRIAYMIREPVFSQCVFAFNFQRGRRRFAAQARERMTHALNLRDPSSETHRGQLLRWELFHLECLAQAGGLSVFLDHGIAAMSCRFRKAIEEGATPEALIAAAGGEVAIRESALANFDAMQFLMRSYYSHAGRCYFDTAIFRSGAHVRVSGRDNQTDPFREKYRRQIAAAMAIRTRRLRGEL
jgi:hypothetical protein